MIELKPRTKTVSLFQGDDLVRHEELLAEMERAARGISGTSARLGDDPKVAARMAAEAFNAFKDEAEERAAKLEIRALGRKAWRDLVANHPARGGDDADEAQGFNVDTFADDLIPACIVEGQFPSVADRDAFLDDLPDGLWNLLYRECLTINQASGPDPKARLSLPPAPTGDETSESPGRLGDL